MKKNKKGLKAVVTSLALATMLCAAPALATACGNKWVDNWDDGQTYANNYNVIMTVATIPPVLAALNSIESGNPTYAWAERGKTYQGINSVDNFTAIEGLNTGSNGTSGLTPDVKTNTLNIIDDIVSNDENAHITLYTVDYNALAAYAVCIQAGLMKNQVTIAMVEDGSKAYNELKTHYVDGMQTAEAAEQHYAQLVKDYEAQLKNIRKAQGASGYTDIEDTAAWALAGLDNFVYYVQDKTRVKGVLDSNANLAGSKLYNVLGVAETEDETVAKSNIVYKSINEHVTGLTVAQKEKYLTLMFGNERATTEALFSRTAAGETAVPAKKLVYICGRVKEAMNYVAEMADLNELTANYADLDAKYKEVFTTEDDYTLAYNIVNASTLSAEAKLAAINLYMDYTYQLKLIYMLYGNEYDLLFKGHPRELVEGTWEDSRYTVGTGENAVVYTALEQALVRAFYANDSIGKMIGILPGGVAAENFAYLGYEFAIGGVSSSTYTGYDPTIIVEFIQTVNADTIQSNGNVSARFAAGTLTWTKGVDTDYTTLMLNNGQTYKVLAEYFTAHGNATLATKYQNAFKAWLIATGDGITEANVANYTVDRQGNIVQVI